MRHPQCVSPNDSPSPNQRTFFVKLCQILQKLPQRSTVYFASRQPWKWSKTEQDAFDSIKAALCVFYSTSLQSHSWASFTAWCFRGLARSCLQPGPDAHYNKDTKHAVQNKITLKLSAIPCPLLGRHSKLLTDHKPLIILFGEHNCLCPSRQQRESKDAHYF